jgi:hypothetical protein
MIGKINERVPENERISYFWWGGEVQKRYKLFYPASKLALLADLYVLAFAKKQRCSTTPSVAIPSVKM